MVRTSRWRSRARGGLPPAGRACRCNIPGRVAVRLERAHASASGQGQSFTVAASAGSAPEGWRWAWISPRSRRAPTPAHPVAACVRRACRPRNASASASSRRPRRRYASLNHLDLLLVSPVSSIEILCSSSAERLTPVQPGHTHSRGAKSLRKTWNGRSQTLQTSQPVRATSACAMRLCGGLDISLMAIAGLPRLRGGVTGLGPIRTAVFRRAPALR